VEVKLKKEIFLRFITISKVCRLGPLSTENGTHYTEKPAEIRRLGRLFTYCSDK